MATETQTPKEVKRVTVLEQLKRLDEQRAQLLDGAKNEALQKANDAITVLNGLGFSYSLVEGDAAPKRKAAGEKKPRAKKDCTICKFGTDPHHDGRHPAHRDQEPKKPFTEKQLKELGLEKKSAA